LESSHIEKWAMVKEGWADHRCHKHNPWKRRNDSTPVGHLGRIALRWEQRGM
jgi:hypothetical protein